MAAFGRTSTRVKPVILDARPITRADLACLPKEREQGVNIVQKLRNHHHRIARLDASGMRESEICEIADISYNRLHYLRKTPAYVELVAQYKRDVHAAFIQAQDEFTRLSLNNMMRAEQQIADHIDDAEEAGELIPLKTLLSVTADRADRFGYPKGSVQMKVAVGNQLERAMVRSGRTITVDAKSNSPALAPRGQGEAMQVQPLPSERIVSGSSNPDRSAPTPARALVSRRGF